MKPGILLLGAILSIGMGSCTKEGNHSTQTPTEEAPVTQETDPFKDYTTYTIPQGQNYCNGNAYENIEGIEALDFSVVFDSTCMYTNADPANQADINKLMGFSDCNTLHQVNSARFGWNWMDGKIYLYAYCYYNSERRYKTLAAVSLDTAQHLKMYVSGNNYLFQVNGKNDTMPRYCSADRIWGYRLLPYFGGDEPAPHTVNIRIKYY